jgi:hypothetical protein
MNGKCYWLKYVTDCTELLTILGDEWNVLLWWVIDNSWRWVECVTDWNKLLTILLYWQYFGMCVMCYWLKYVTDSTELLTILGCWIHLGFWIYYPIDRTGLITGPTYWLYRFAGWTWLLTVRTLLLTRLGCWLDRAFGGTSLLAGQTPIFLASQTDWTGVLVILHWDWVAGSIDSLIVSRFNVWAVYSMIWSNKRARNKSEKFNADDWDVQH